MSIININFEKNSNIKISFPEFLKNEKKEDDNIGNNINDFIPLKIIGSGSYGNIIKVKSKINNKIYAMKIMGKHNNNKYSILEILILKKLDHPNIVKYIKDFEDNLNYYIIIEYIIGQNLFDFYMSCKIQGRLIEEKLICTLLGQCLEAIIYIHGKGVIHRDVKFLNIMIDEKMNIKIIDFNSSIIMDASAAKDFTNDKNFIPLIINHGTEITNNFEAPEIKVKNYNAKVDVFSLGKIFYELCNINNNFYSYSKELQDIILLMINPDQDKRPTINEVHKKYYLEYYSIKYFKYSSLFSSLQCLFNYPIWIQYFKNNRTIKDKEISKFFFQSLIKSKNNQIFEKYIKDLKKDKLEFLYENNDKNEEIDPILFINFIMSKLNEELNILDGKQEYKYIKNKKLLKKERLDNYTQKYKNNILSVITDNFLGILELTINCEKCPEKDYKFNYFYYLSFNMEFLIEKNIELNNNNIFKLLLFNEIKRNVVCQKCKQKTQCVENIKIFSVPKNLIIFFDRRKKNKKEKIKIHKNINFPEILILDGNNIELFYIKKKKPEKIQYYLYSILCQIQDDEDNEVYISFTREEEKRNENNKENDNNFMYYSFGDIKESFNIIGLFYYSDEQKIINNHNNNQVLYKMNKCKQNEKYFNSKTLINNNDFNNINNYNNFNNNNNVNYNNYDNNNMNNDMNNYNYINYYRDNNMNNNINNNFNNNMNNNMNSNINNNMNNNMNNNINNNMNRNMNYNINNNIFNNVNSNMNVNMNNKINNNANSNMNNNLYNNMENYMNNNMNSNNMNNNLNNNINNNDMNFNMNNNGNNNNIININNNMNSTINNNYNNYDNKYNSNFLLNKPKVNINKINNNIKYQNNVIQSVFNGNQNSDNYINEN